MRYFIKRNNLSNITCKRITATAMLWSVIFVFGMLSSLVASAQGLSRDNKEQIQENKITTAREAFANLNIPALEILKRTTRLDMLDYWDADSIYKATNAMSGLSWIENCAPDYMKIHLTPVSTLELKMLPMKKGSVITMAIYTVGNDVQAQDSQVTFSDENMQSLDTKKFFHQPKLEDFFDIPKGSLTSMKEIKEMIPFPTVAYNAVSDSDELTARLTVGAFMNIDDYNIVKLFLKPEVRLKWNGKEFKVES